MHLPTRAAKIALMLALSAALSANASSAPASGPPAYKIGVIVGAIGITADWGVALRRAAQFALDDYNAGGGYHGRPAEIVFCENEGKPERAIECANKLIQEDQVSALVGGAPSGSVLAMLNIPQDRKVAYMGISAATSITTRYKDSPENFIFRGGAPDSAQLSALLRWAKSRKYSRIGLFYDTTGYGLDAKKDFDREAKPAGFTIAAEVSFGVTDTDLTPQVQTMRDAKPDAVLVYTVGAPGARLFAAAKKIGYTTNWAASWGLAAADFMRLAGADGNGLHVSVPFAVGQTKALAAFHDRMMRVYNEDPMGVQTPLAYDAVTMVLQAVNRSGLDRVKLRDAIETTSDFHGITDIPAKPFTHGDHDALHDKDLTVDVIRDGQVRRQ